MLLGSAPRRDPHSGSERIPPGPSRTGSLIPAGLAVALEHESPDPEGEFGENEIVCGESYGGRSDLRDGCFAGVFGGASES